MAKWTKSNNPHTWAGKTMAKTRTQVVRYAAPPRQAAPIIVRTSTRAPAKKKHHRRRSSSHGGTATQQGLISLALGGAIYGFLEKSFGATLPTLPIVGRAGTITIAAYFFSKGRGGILADVARAGAVISGYQIGSTGKIAGDVDGVVPQISGIAAQV